MLNRIDVINSQGTVLGLPLSDTSSGLIVAEITGLDPVKATLVTSSFANMDGVQYHNSRRESRNIKIKLELDPDYILTSVQELRSFLYPFFMPKLRPLLRFTLDNEIVADISGVVESFDTPLFTREPTADISIMCFDPDFYDPTPSLFQWGTTALTTEGVIEYLGSVDTGLEFVLNVNRSLSEFVLFNRTDDGVIQAFEFTFPLVAGDVLRVNTNRGAKAVTLTRGGTSTSLLYATDPTSNWIQLQPGDNYIRAYTPGVEIPFDIHYTTKYGGL